MFVTMSEMNVGVAGGVGPNVNSDTHAHLPKIQPDSSSNSDSQDSTRNSELDSLASSPASPAVSVNHGEIGADGRVINSGNATPMPLLPQMLFNAARSAQSQREQNNRQSHSRINHSSSSDHDSSAPKAKIRRLGFEPPPPGFRTDPGAPPGCFEHSLNILGGKFLLLDQLEGSHLQRCIDVNTKQEFVCKTVRNDPCGQAMLTAHNRVDGHAHINPLQEVIVGDKFSYLFFPPCSTDLHSYVRTRRRLREPHARILFRQIVSAVHEAHSKGLVLRDLKLRKFVFTDESRTTLRLESLEDAVVLETEDDLLSDKHGCPAYVSPEILRTNSQYSGRAADMWGLGVMLYTMLVGRYPFHGQEHTGLFAKIRRGQFTLPDSISSRAKCLIRCLLRKDPTQRLTTEDVLIHPWVTLATPTSASCHASSSRESRRVSSSNLTHPVPSSAGHQTGGSGSNGGTNHSGGSGSNGAGPQQTPQMLAGVTTNTLGATPTQLLSSSTNLGSSHHHQFHHNHHSSVDQNNMDQIVPEFFPPHQDEMELSHLK